MITAIRCMTSTGAGTGTGPEAGPGPGLGPKPVTGTRAGPERRVPGPRPGPVFSSSQPAGRPLPLPLAGYIRVGAPKANTRHAAFERAIRSFKLNHPAVGTAARHAAIARSVSHAARRTPRRVARSTRNGVRKTRLRCKSIQPARSRPLRNSSKPSARVSPVRPRGPCSVGNHRPVNPFDAAAAASTRVVKVKSVCVRNTRINWRSSLRVLEHSVATAAAAERAALPDSTAAARLRAACRARVRVCRATALCSSPVR